MLNAMYSGISGLNANQKKLDVIGNNIANSGTTSFKSSRVTFQDSMRQSMSKATGSSLNVGGTNPKQIGMGVQLQSIDVNMGQGSLQPTGRPLDVAIDQAGYFIVSKGPIDGTITLNNQTISGGGMENYFTRDGAFRLTSEGYLVTPNGYRVMGYAINESITHGADGIKAKFADADEELKAGTDLVPLAIPETVTKGSEEMRIQSYSIEKDGLLKATLADGSVTVLGQLAMATFNNTGALEGVGQNMYTPTSNSGAAMVRTGKGATADNGKAYGDMIQGCLEMSNVDLAEQFTDMIVASRSFQACSKVITTGDEILQELVNLKR
ncbi:flagellar hook-basal body complex protein [Clostridium sp. UBA6640]|uniref:flagellar hook-basal body complex protein n=1 Tax=Clostridium sp. UBA6640 TaxID=1946370 RepID=UPI0025B7F121|nr:flagellar hook-basal body complex protein [Clostridium sp. UBA6640]